MEIHMTLKEFDRLVDIVKRLPRSESTDVIMLSSESHGMGSTLTISKIITLQTQSTPIKGNFSVDVSDVAEW